MSLRTLPVVSLLCGAIVVSSIFSIPTSSSASALVPPHSGIGSDRTKISELEQAIAAEGDRAEGLVARYNAVDSQLATLDSQLRSERNALSTDRRTEKLVGVKLRRAAIDAYVDGASGNSAKFAALTSSSSSSALAEQQVYIGVASGQLADEVSAMQVAEHASSTTERVLGERRSEAARTLAALRVARQAAASAIRADQTLLGGLDEHMLALIAAANFRREKAAEARAEKKIAARAANLAAIQAAQAASTTTSTTTAQAATSTTSASTTTTAPPAVPAKPVTTPTAHAGSASYENPLRGISGLESNRIDQGVDYGGFGPIYAIGDGVVLSTYCGGWPGGTFISYRLTSGPAAGLIVYAAEDIQPTVSVGQSVTSATVLGQVYEGSTGIEVGWASSPDGLTMAAVYNQFDGENTTAFGANYSELLSSLGAPGGVFEGGPAGSLPAGWPTW